MIHPRSPIHFRLLWIFLAAILLCPGWASAFPEDLKPGGVTCQTACHEPENLERARREKNSLEACRRCHEGGPPAMKDHTGAAPHPFVQTEDFRPNRRILSGRPARPAASPKTRAGAKSPTKVPGMAFIEAGEFIMGSNERWDDESPEHINRTGAFFIDLYEVTNDDYRKFVDATGHAAPHHWPEGRIPEGKGNHPVVYVSWFDADAYCRWADRRLPTEPEWEKAARGEDGNIYPWGNVWTLDKSNNPYKHSTGTEPVGSYPDGRSPYGLYDMSGNVWEWVDAYYLPHPGNTIPKPEYGTDKRVLKGGSWFDCLSYGCGLSAPTFNRSFFNPEVKNNSFGFRCARDP